MQTAAAGEQATARASRVEKDDHSFKRGRHLHRVAFRKSACRMPRPPPTPRARARGDATIEPVGGAGCSARGAGGGCPQTRAGGCSRGCRGSPARSSPPPRTRPPTTWRKESRGSRGKSTRTLRRRRRKRPTAAAEPPGDDGRRSGGEGPTMAEAVDADRSRACRSGLHEQPRERGRRGRPEASLAVGSVGGRPPAAGRRRPSPTIVDDGAAVDGRRLINNPPKFFRVKTPRHRAHWPLAIHSSMMTRASDTFDGTWNSAFSSSPLSTNART